MINQSRSTHALQNNTASTDGGIVHNEMPCRVRQLIIINYGWPLACASTIQKTPQCHSETDLCIFEPPCRYAWAGILWIPFLRFTAKFCDLDYAGLRIPENVCVLQ